MKSKKIGGFTLIELLAVIVILAIIALIITPMITDLIKKAKASSDLRSAEAYAKAAENYYAETTLDINKASSLGTNIIDSLKVNNAKATGEVYVYSDGTVAMAIVLNNKCYKKTVSQYIDQIEVSDNLNACNTSGIDPTTIYGKVITKFPYLEIGTDGCKTNTSGTNYNYMGGCYLAGAHTDNYVWYSGFVWRIMGINSDKSVRMITEENETAIPYNAANTTTFKGSHAEDWLNNYFYSHLKNTSIIANGNWCERGTNYVTSNTSNSTTCIGTTINDKIGLISIDEYNLTSAKSSYLFNEQYYWTLTPKNSSNAWVVDSYGSARDFNVSAALGLRPVINVNSASSITNGNGTLSDSYILGETKGTNITGNLKDIATSGEYVTLANKTYRVVRIDSNGNTKLILDGYYEETAETNYKMIYESTSTFNTTTTTGVGYKLNNDVLNWLIPSSDTTNRNKLVTYNWYQNNFNDGNSYTVSLNETNPTRTISATVGLIRVGEMLSDQSLTILNKNNTVTNSYSNTATYWTMTPYTSSSRAWNVSSYGNALNDFDSGSSTFGLRPVLVVNSSVTITSGNGTPQSPYQI